MINWAFLGHSPVGRPASEPETRRGYAYTQDLVRLEECRPDPQRPVGLPAVVRVVQTPLQVEIWERELRSHPDREFVAYLLRGMKQGFRIGFNRHVAQLKSARRNMRSAEEFPDVVDSYLAKERGAGRVIGPLSGLEAARAGVHVRRFGVIPKPHQPGKWRLIVDLSHPNGQSVNDGVSSELCSLTYASIDQAASIIVRLGRFSELAKVDVASAYRILPVHPEDRPLLGMKWKGELFVDAALPFGLRSAPKVFTALADGVQWILQR